MAKGHMKFYVFLSLMVLVSASQDDGIIFGNILDVSWRLPEPQGTPRTSCERDIQSMYTNLRSMTHWAYEMWDATAKAPSGLLRGNRGHFGNFDECVGDDGAQDGNRVMQRQYCLVNTHMESFPHTKYAQGIQPEGPVYNQLYTKGEKFKLDGNGAYWGICAPASCDHTELSSLLQDHFRRESLKIHASRPQLETMPGSNETVRHEIQAKIVSPFMCQKHEDAVSIFYGTGTILIWIFCGITLLAVSVATIYHRYKIQEANGDYESSGIVKALSLVNSIKGLLYQGSGELGVLNGIRVLSIVYIILGHRCMLTLHAPVFNWKYIEVNTSGIGMMVCVASELMVDNFFLLSGILIAYRLLKWSPGSPLRFRDMIIDRYIRLMPVYIMTMLLTAFILPHLGSGPLWVTFTGREVYNCMVSWWSNILMINNYVNTDKACIGQTWFVACEFHYFLLSLSVLWLLRTRPQQGMLYLQGLLVMAILIPGYLVYKNKLSAVLLFTKDNMAVVEADDYFKNIYITSHSRAGPYLIGLLVGYLLVKYKESARLSMKTSMVVAVVSLGLMLAVIYTRFLIAYLTAKDYPVTTVLYTATYRTIWAVGLGSLILTCILGQVPAVTSFLSWGFWTPLARLVYGVFLVHSAVQLRLYGVLRSPTYIDHIILFGEVFTLVFYSFLVSMVLHLFIESPCRGIFSMLMKQNNSSKKTKKS